MSEDIAKEPAPVSGTAGNTVEGAPEDDALMRCPCCGKNTLKTPLKVNAELMDHYMSCVMTGVPFWHEYPLYNGRIVLRIKMLDAEHQQLLDRVSTALEILQDATNIQTEKLQVNQLRVLIRNQLHLEQVKVSNGPGMKTWNVAETVADKIKAFFTKDTGTTIDIAQYKALYELCHDATLVSGLSEQLLAVTIDTHYRLSSILIATGIDENFWRGIELV